MGKKTSDKGFEENLSRKQSIQADYESILTSFNEQLKNRKNLSQEDLLEEKYQSARKKGNSISLFGALFKWKHNKIGRFGQKTISKKDDKGSVFEKLDNGDKVKYFDPFEKIEEKSGENEKSGDLREKLMTAFVDRSMKNEQLVSKSDFERSQLTDDAKTHAYVSWYQTNREQLEKNKNQTNGEPLEENINQTNGEPLEENKSEHREVDEKAINNTLSEQFASQFDGSKSFIPDYITNQKDPDPDQFEVVVVVQPPSDVYLDYNKQVTKETNFVIKGLKPDYMKILDENMKKSDAYAELYKKGNKEAQEVGENYDPNKDPNIWMLRAQTMENIQYGQGHSFVRMVAKRDGQSYSSYSFGFWPLAITPGTGSVTMGTVKNPDPEALEGSVIEHAFPISYANYLRAAAKIRGVVGSQRSYSFLGYNCTSFAADIAKEAGVAIKDDDSSEKIRTFKYRSARIDSPYSLAKFIHMKNNEEQNTNNDGARKRSQTEVPEEVKEKIKDMSFLEQTDGKMLQDIMDMVDEQKKIADHPEDQLTIDISYDTKGRVARDQLTAAFLFNAQTGLIEKLEANKLFLRLQNAFAPGQDNNKSHSYALQLFQAILASTKHYLEDIEEKVDAEIDAYISGQTGTDIDKPYDLSGVDFQTAIRKLGIARRRDWMMKTFGYLTSTEYLSAVVQKPEILAKAVMKLKEDPKGKQRDVDLGNDRIYQILAGGQTDVGNSEIPEKGTLLTRIKDNPFFQSPILPNDTIEMLGESLGVSPAEMVLDAILEMSKTLEAKQIEMEEGAFDKKSDYEKVNDMINLRSAHEDLFGKESVLEGPVRNFIISTCSDPDKLKQAIRDGLAYNGYLFREILYV